MHPRIVVFAGRYGSLLRTLECARMLAPAEHILVVAAARDHHIHGHVARHPGVELMLPPHEIGSGPALLLALARVRYRDPLAPVVMLPTESAIVQRPPLLASSDAAYKDQVTALGLWRRDASGAHALMIAGRITAFWNLARRTLPQHTELFEEYVAAIRTPYQRPALRAAIAYAYAKPVSFRKDMLACDPELVLAQLPPNAVQMSSIGAAVAEQKAA